MPITGLTVSLDKRYYSRYEAPNSVIKASVTPTGTGDSVTVTLSRQTPPGWSTLATQTLPAMTGPATVAFDLTTLQTAYGYPAALQSTRPDDYRVTATHASNSTITASAYCTLMLMSPEMMRTNWLYGLSLKSTETLEVRVQPAMLTGVTVVSVGTESRHGTGVLAWLVGPHTLTWRGGAPVPVNMAGGILRYALPDTLTGYLLVEVDPALLPVVDTSETLALDFGTISDDMLARQIVATVDEIERGIMCKLEPNHYVTNLLLDPTANPTPPTAYDLAIPGTAWYHPNDYYRWMSIKLPLAQVHKLIDLSGWFNSSKTMIVPKEWYVVTPMAGLVELIPANAAIVNWFYYGPWMPALVSGVGHVAEFWQFECISGLKEVPEALRLFIAKRAAINVLAIAGQARNPSGITGGGLSRDGVSESKSLNPMGVYGSIMRQYQDETGLTPGTRAWTLEDWKAYLTGVQMVVI